MAVQEGINTYCTVEYADEYFAGKVYAEEWQAADQQTKERALKEATRRIERLTFRGERAVKGQLLSFPRVVPVMVGPGAFKLVLEDSIKDPVKQACCEEALALLRWGNSSRARAQEQNVIRVQFGDVSEEYRASLKLLSKEALELLRPYIAGAVAIR